MAKCRSFLADVRGDVASVSFDAFGMSGFELVASVVGSLAWPGAPAGAISRVAVNAEDLGTMSVYSSVYTTPPKPLSTRPVELPGLPGGDQFLKNSLLPVLKARVEQQADKDGGAACTPGSPAPPGMCGFVSIT
ncbi:hypothetical protein ACWCSD_40685 [Nonomuraea sp. NPDC001684]